MSKPVWLSIVVPVYLGHTYFKQCIAALSDIAQDDVELIVVADGEGDGSWRIALDYGAVTHKISGPGGPARARNFGASVAQGQILFFVDADVIVHPDVVDRLRDIFAEQDIAAVIGSYDAQPTEPDFLSQYRNLLHHHVHQTSEEEASTFWGACGAIRRSVFLETGGFDERYSEPAIEDIAFGYKLRRAGYRIRLDKALYVTHLKRWTLIGMLKTDLFQRAIPWTRLLLAERGFVNDLNLRTSSRISVVLAYISVLSALGALWHPATLIAAATALLALVVLNREMYYFFQRARGTWFALRVVPWHTLYYLYSGLGFALGTLIYGFRDSRLAHSTVAHPQTGAKGVEK